MTVAVTPTGCADSVVDDCFVTPLEHIMKMHHFLDVLAGRREKSPKGVYYIQKQNSNFVEEFSELHSDAEVNLPWATQVFGKSHLAWCYSSMSLSLSSLSLCACVYMTACAYAVCYMHCMTLMRCV